MSTKLIQRIHKTNTKEVIHSSVYAKAQADGNFNVRHSDSFADRQRLEHNRKLVQGYNRSQIMQGGNRMPKAASVEETLPTVAVINDESASNYRKSTSNPNADQTPLQQIITKTPDANNDWYVSQMATKSVSAADAAKDAAVARGYGRTSSSDMQGYGRTSTADGNRGYGRTASSDVRGGYGRTDSSEMRRGYGKTTAAEMRQQKMSGYSNLAAQRQARADRFAGGVRTANGGTIAARPASRPPMSFGRH